MGCSAAPSRLPSLSLLMRRIYKSPGNRNANRSGRNGRYLVEAMETLCSGTGGSPPGAGTLPGSSRSAAGLEGEALSHNADDCPSYPFPVPPVPVKSPARSNNSIKALRTCSWLAPPIRSRARSTISHPGDTCGSTGRTASRINLLARLRWTAFPTERLALTAKRGLSSSLRSAINTTSG